MQRERQMHHIEIILAQAHFMSELMDDVLTINKARAGKLEFNPVPLNLVSFCQETLERVEVLNQGKHQFAFTHEGDMSGVRLDVKQLQHILVNLLSNAVKYSPEGGEVRLGVKAENGSVEFRISDQGIGIPEESLAHLFEPFYRARNTGDIGGTGLGLPIVKAGVDRHGGTIVCETALNAGTTFVVRLPTRHDLPAAKLAPANDSL
jgi:signal transduction histidine kinase